MARWIEGTVVENIKWTDTLYSLRVKADIAPFTAGQFGRLAMEIEGKPLGRPYSFVNSPDDDVLEFYSIVVADGPLSPKLHKLEPGEAVLVGPKGGGFFTLDMVPDADTLWMLSTGTALGPFLSMLGTDAPWQRYKKIVLVHAVRLGEELTYQAQIKQHVANKPDVFQYIPFVSREEAPDALPGRVPAAIISGALEERAGLTLHPENSQVMICGNPDMVRDTQEALAGRGFTPNTRKVKGHVTTENYW